MALSMQEANPLLLRRIRTRRKGLVRVRWRRRRRAASSGPSWKRPTGRTRSALREKPWFLGARAEDGAVRSCRHRRFLVVRGTLIQPHAEYHRATGPCDASQLRAPHSCAGVAAPRFVSSAPRSEGTAQIPSPGAPSSAVETHPSPGCNVTSDLARNRSEDGSPLSSAARVP